MIHNSLFISNFKQKGILLKRIVTTFLVIALVGVAINVLNRIYCEEEPWDHILWKNFYEQDSIDNIFIGSSHVFYDVNPFILDELNGMNNFNLASGSQTLSASYYLLKEADRVYDISSVFVELFYLPNSGPNTATNLMTINWKTYDHLRPSLVKLEYALADKDSSHYLETLIPFIRYRSNLFDVERIEKIRKQKNSEDWKNYKYKYTIQAGTEEYFEKGYARTDRSIESANQYLYNTEINLATAGILTDDNSEYMRKIMAYCTENNIKLKFFISPIYETQILSTRGYDMYSRQVRDIANEGNIELYDFNLCKTEYLDIIHQDLFRDNGHLNETGAAIFTPFLWNVLNHSYEENAVYFCNSYSEKISLDNPELYGIYWEECDEGKSCTFASNTDSELEYYIEFVSEDGLNDMVIQDFSLSKQFIIPNDVSEGRLIVRARNINSKDVVTFFEIVY